MESKPAEAAEDVMNEIGRLRDHIDADHAVMVKLGRIADAAVQMLELINMDTDEDRELHARAVSALRSRLDEMAATMREANEASPSLPLLLPGRLGTNLDMPDPGGTWKAVHPVYGPAECPQGHFMEPGHFQRSWTPCICPPAQATGRNGHDTWRCNACQDAGLGELAVFYDPPHRPVEGRGVLAGPGVEG